VVQAECGIYLSDPGSAMTWRWADHDNNNIVNLTDVLLVVSGFQGDFSGAPLETIDIWGGSFEPCQPNRIINLDDMMWTIRAFQGITYPNTGCPIPCR
jgi:hypothetical protein